MAASNTRKTKKSETQIYQKTGVNELGQLKHPICPVVSEKITARKTTN